MAGFWDKFGKPVEVLAALIAVVAAVFAYIKYVPPFPQNREEQMVSRLVPGDDYNKMLSIIGTGPDRTLRLKMGQTYRIFKRDWEYLGLLVSRSGAVLSVGVWATNASFQATVGEARVTANASTIAKLSHGALPIGAWGTCGASYGEYFEGYSGYEANGNESSVVGAWSLENSGANYCRMLLVPNRCISAAYRHMQRQVLSAEFFKCMTDSTTGRNVRARLSPSVVIVTAANQPITAYMLIPPAGPLLGT